VSLGIPFPTLNAYLSSSVECFGSLLLIIGFASRLTAILVAVTMSVAYLTADLEAVTSIFSDPGKFVKADPFPYFICALIVLVFGPGRFSIDMLISRKLAQTRRS
jgi:putative oxidoreductase